MQLTSVPNSFVLYAFRTCRDPIGEAKASGNLGNTLKVIGKFDEAIVCCMRHLEISREQEDKVSRIDKAHEIQL